MSANPSSHEIDLAAFSGGAVWHRLHSEREDICEAILREPLKGSTENLATQVKTTDDIVRAENWHRELLQWRLRKVDDALDRLMSGTYGECSKCGKWIEDTKLEFDPAIEFCLGCWGRLQSEDCACRPTVTVSQTSEQAAPACDSCNQLMAENQSPEGVELNTLSPFDTLRVRTRNSDYRIFILDPSTGRALIEGGCYFREPTEATVYGSTLAPSTYRVGWIGKGVRIEFWADGKVASTSPVESFQVEHFTSNEVVSNVYH